MPPTDFSLWLISVLRRLPVPNLDPAPGPFRLAFEELIHPLLEREEIREVTASLGLNAREVVEELIMHEEEIFGSTPIEMSLRPDLRGWFQSLGVVFQASGSYEDPSWKVILSGVGPLLFTLVTSIFVPALLVLYLALLGAAFMVLFLLTEVGHVKVRFTASTESRLREEVFLPLLRSHLNDLLREAELDEPFQVTDASTLTDISGPEHLVSTEAIRSIERTSASINSGSIGVSGPRGAGKSTLLKNFCENRFAHPSRPELRILIPAPVQYEAKDFVIHVFGHLCTAVLAAAPRKTRPPRLPRLLNIVAGPLLIAGTAWALWPLSDPSLALADLLLWTEYLVLYAALPGLLAFVSGRFLGRKLIQFLRKKYRRTEEVSPVGLGEVVTPAFLGLTLMVFVTHQIITRTWPPREHFDYALLWTPYTPGLLLVLCGILLSVIARRAAMRPEVKRRPSSWDPVSTARRWSNRLRYLETTTSGITGSLQVAKPAQLSGSRTRALAEQQMGLPQLVAEYRDFATATALWWSELHEGRGRLVIGIDEIDKMSSQEAEQFLNQVKALFGTPNCLTLVSVSDDALTDFERRSFTVRDAFDTAFDDIVRVDPLDYLGVRELLTRRISGFPDSLVALCHVLSGGLPRETLRVARTLVRLRSGHQDDGTASLPQASHFAQELVRQEVGVLKKALLAQGLPARSAEGAQRTGSAIEEDIRGSLRTDWPAITAEELLRIGARWWDEADDLAVYAAQFLFLGAVLRLFTDTNRRVGVLLREDEAATIAHSTTLARARTIGVQSPNAQRLLVQEFLHAWEHTD